MTRRNFAHLALIFAAPQLIFVVAANADLTAHVTLNIDAGFNNLQFALYDDPIYNSSSPYFTPDSWAAITNIWYTTSSGSTQISGFIDGQLLIGDPAATVLSGGLTQLANGIRMDEVDGYPFEYPVTTATAGFSAFADSGTLEFDLHLANLLPPEVGNNAGVLAVYTNGKIQAEYPFDQPAVVPAPGAALLAAVGLACVGLVRRLRGQQS